MPYRRRRMGAISLLVSLSFAGEAGAAACLSARDWDAHQVYALRTEALVGAQSCRMTERFNVFAQRHRQELMTEGHALKAYYHRVYGRGGDKALDDYVTYLANASATAQPQGVGFCAAASELLDRLGQLPIGELVKFSRENPPPVRPSLAKCGGHTEARTKQ